MIDKPAFITCRGKCGLSKPREKFTDSAGRVYQTCRVCYKAEVSRRSRAQVAAIRNDPETQARLLARITGPKRKCGIPSLSQDYKWVAGVTPRSRMAALPPATRELAESLLRRYLSTRQHLVGTPGWTKKYAALCGTAVRWAKFKIANPGVNFGKVLIGKRKQRRRLLTMMGLRNPTLSRPEHLMNLYKTGRIDFETMNEELAKLANPTRPRS